jgi:hypothetical protein
MKQLKLSLDLPAISVRKMLPVAILAVVPLVAVGAALATPPLFFTGTPIARGTTPGQFKIKLKDSSCQAVASLLQVSLAPGGHRGWHGHPGSAVGFV